MNFGIVIGAIVFGIIIISLIIFALYGLKVAIYKDNLVKKINSEKEEQKDFMPLTLNEFKDMDQAARYTYGKTLPLGHNFDDKGNQISYRDIESWYICNYDSDSNEKELLSSNGFWRTIVYDKNNNILNEKDSYGNFYENVFDKNGKWFTHKSNKYFIKVIKDEISKEQYKKLIELLRDDHTSFHKYYKRITKKVKNAS